MRELNMHCIDCDVDTDAIDEFYMVQNELWEKAVPNQHDQEERVLCVGCLEARIGRTLIAADFTDAPVNKRGSYSLRLLERLTASS